MEVGAAATLLVRGGPNNGVIIKLTGRRVTLDPPRGFVLRDLNTTNGAFINRHRIGQNERLLEHGDQIKLGESEVMQVFQQDAPGTVVVEAANTPPHGVYILRSPRRRTCPSRRPPPNFRKPNLR